MKTMKRRLVKVILLLVIVAVLWLFFVSIQNLPVMGEHTCDLPVTKRYIWQHETAEDIAARHTDISVVRRGEYIEERVIRASQEKGTQGEAALASADQGTLEGGGEGNDVGDSKDRLLKLKLKDNVNTKDGISVGGGEDTNHMQITKDQENSVNSIPKVTEYVTEYPWLSDNVLARAVSQEEHQQLLGLTSTIAGLLEAADITYMMSFGTLLGSYIFQDIIPWDDDMDLLVDIKDLLKVKALFANEAVRGKYGFQSFGDVENMWDLDKLRLEKETHGFDFDAVLTKVKRNLVISRIYSGDPRRYDIVKEIRHENDMCKIWRNQYPRYFKAKFYSLEGQQAGGYNWTWPFVDLIFYESVKDQANRRQICTLDIPSERMCQYEDVVFPLSRRPLGFGGNKGTLWLPAPKNTRAFLQKRFPRFTCRVGTWDHIHERWNEKSGTWRECEELRPTYPVVGRECNGENKKGVTEKLMLGDKLLRSMYFPLQSCPWDSNPYSLV